ncbi:MAG TPA: SIMPL domain-containing protein [Methyloceanibacter sp.]|nr:SIMPL domain-containing protein [Methyloceanibacter sp.]
MPSPLKQPLALLAFIASTAFPAAPSLAHDEAPKRTISLSATGAVKTTPDKVDISTGVTSEAKTAREALDQNTQAMSKVVAALKEDGIAEKDIQTVNFSVGPVYEQRPYDRPDGKPPLIVGYRVTNQVRITLHDTKKLGAILDKVVSLGSNQIDSIEFGVDEPEALKDEARKLALKNVTGNAKLYAEAAGVGLGQILSIAEEESAFYPRAVPAAAAFDTAKEAVPIEAGTATVEIRVRVTWEID